MTAPLGSTYVARGQKWTKEKLAKAQRARAKPIRLQDIRGDLGLPDDPAARERVVRAEREVLEGWRRLREAAK